MRYTAIPALAFALLGTTGCSERAEQHSEEEEHGVEWAYLGDTGPQEWAGLSPEFSTCGSGNEQSPIDLTGATPDQLPELVFDYPMVADDVLNNGHTEEAKPTVAGYATLTGGLYKLLQYHFHTPSEHTIDGRHYPMEMHLVHAAENGGLAVVGVLFEEGDLHDTLELVLNDAPASQNEPTGHTEPLDPEDLLPTSRDYYAYSGSLTTPPCTEGISWHVFAAPSQASEQQIATVVRYLGHSNRPVQTMGPRELRIGG